LFDYLLLDQGIWWASYYIWWRCV